MSNKSTISHNSMKRVPDKPSNRYNSIVLGHTQKENAPKKYII